MGSGVTALLVGAPSSSSSAVFGAASADTLAITLSKQADASFSAGRGAARGGDGTGSILKNNGWVLTRRLEVLAGLGSSVLSSSSKVDCSPLPWAHWPGASPDPPL